nr:L,D-transpeptidase [Streptomyces sp. JJ38]
MARNSAGTFVTGLTAVAMAVIGFFAYQASAAQNEAPRGRQAEPAASPSPSAGPEQEAPGLPAESGEGRRVVYSLADDRVWLVGADGSVLRTYGVTPGTLDPVAGVYTVTSRDERVTGTDGVPVQHVVRFTTLAGTGIGFSAPVEDGRQPVAEPGKKTGGIRESRADGAAMWEFATLDTPVVVVR